MKQFRSFLSPLSLGEVSRGRSARLLLLASLFLASCGEQTELEQPGITGGETVEVIREIKINVLPIQSVGGAATRSATDKPEKGESIVVSYNDAPTTRVQEGTTDMTTDESKITNAYIVQFNGTGPDATVASVSANIATQLSAGTPITHTFSMATGVKNRVYVVANVETVPEINTTKLSTFEAPISYLPKLGLPSKGLPMSAHQDVSIGDAAFDVFQLKSLLAKLTFTVKTDIFHPSDLKLKLIGMPLGYSFNNGTAGDEAYRPSGMTYGNGYPLLSGSTIYIPENLSGRNDLLLKHYTRALGMAPADAMGVKILAGNRVCYVLLGDGSVSDFNVVGGYAYNIKATLNGLDEYDLRMGENFTQSPIDLNPNGETANSYLVHKNSAWYMFKNTVMGNGKATLAYNGNVALDIIPSKLNPSDASVLWETLNTATPPSAGDIVTANIYPLKDRFLFKSGDKDGNAVIAAKDANGTILWSWHIWKTTEKPSEFPLLAITRANQSMIDEGEFVLMDRNLGALSATPGNDLVIGLYYQWGRKDPFPGYATMAGAANSTLPANVTSTSDLASVADAVSNPTTFNVGKFDEDIGFSNNLWGTEVIISVTGQGDLVNLSKGSKSIYDPCPVGWRVPPVATFARASLSESPWDDTSKGRNLVNITTVSKSDNLFFPASGNKKGTDATLLSVAVLGSYWLSSPTVTYGSIQPKGVTFTFKSDAVYTMGSSNLTQGSSCRCMREL